MDKWIEFSATFGVTAATKITDSCHHYHWQLLPKLLAVATKITDSCHYYHWQLPLQLLAAATKITDSCHHYHWQLPPKLLTAATKITDSRHQNADSGSCHQFDHNPPSEFWYGIWKMLRMEWNGRSSSILTTQADKYISKLTRKLRSTTKLE